MHKHNKTVNGTALLTRTFSGYRLVPVHIEDIECDIRNVSCLNTLDAGYQCHCHLANGTIVPINGTDCEGQ